MNAYGSRDFVASNCECNYGPPCSTQASPVWLAHPVEELRQEDGRGRAGPVHEDQEGRERLAEAQGLARVLGTLLRLIPVAIVDLV